MENEFIVKLDENNTKALSVASLALKALENGLDDVDVIACLEVIVDYLKLNYRIFDQNM